MGSQPMESLGHPSRRLKRDPKRMIKITTTPVRKKSYPGSSQGSRRSQPRSQEILSNKRLRRKKGRTVWKMVKPKAQLQRDRARKKTVPNLQKMELQKSRWRTESIFHLSKLDINARVDEAIRHD